jgi:hypothetical protein
MAALYAMEPERVWHAWFQQTVRKPAANAQSVFATVLAVAFKIWLQG